MVCADLVHQSRLEKPGSSQAFKQFSEELQGIRYGFPLALSAVARKILHLSAAPQ